MTGSGIAAWNFVTRVGSQLMLDDHPFYANGWNSYWLMVTASESNTRSRVDTILRDGASLGLTVCRTWAFNDDTYQALQMSPGRYDEKVFQALDYVIHQARCNGVRLLLSLVNNWKDYGGKPKYVEWARAAGENIDSDDGFFLNANCRQFYKDHVKAVLTRVNTITKVEYRNDPTIFGWELMNEPQCASDSSGHALKSWIEEMAAYVKSLDNNHLLTVGSEGFYASNSEGCSSANPNSYAGTIGTDFIRDHRVPGIDFATVHAYPDSWLGTDNVDEKLKFFNRWVRAHIDDAERILRMPVLFTEFGLSDKKTGFCDEKRDAFYSIVYDQVYQSAQNQGAAAGALQWQLLPPAMMDWNDGYGCDPECGSSICSMMAHQSARLKFISSTPGHCHNEPDMDSHSMSGHRNHGDNSTSSPHRHSISNMIKSSIRHIFK